MSKIFPFTETGYPPPKKSETWDPLPPIIWDMGPPSKIWDMGPPQLWTDTQSENITSRHPSDAGGKNELCCLVQQINITAFRQCVSSSPHCIYFILFVAMICLYTNESYWNLIHEVFWGFEKHVERNLYHFKSCLSASDGDSMTNSISFRRKVLQISFFKKKTANTRQSSFEQVHMVLKYECAIWKHIS